MFIFIFIVYSRVGKMLKQFEQKIMFWFVLALKMPFWAHFGVKNRFCDPCLSILTSIDGTFMLFDGILMLIEHICWKNTGTNVWNKYKQLIKLHNNTHKRSLQPIKGCAECTCCDSARVFIDIRSIYDNYYLFLLFFEKCLSIIGKII